VTRRIEIPFDFHGVVSDPWGLRAGFASEFTVDRRDFGITWDRIFDWGLMAGTDREAGAFNGPTTEHLDACHRILERLGIPLAEVASETVLRETTQVGQFDRQTGRIRTEEPEEGKHIARLARAVERLPVWSSGVTLGLTRDRRPGYVQLHWPELSPRVLHEANRLRHRVSHGWEAPPHPGAKVESVEAGIIHSPAIAFLMDMHPVIRVVYRPAAGLRGQKPVLYLDRHGRPVPMPRQADIPAEPAVERTAIRAK